MEQKQTTAKSVWAQVEPYCVLRRIWHNLWMVLLCAGLFALLAYIGSSLMVHPSYSCSATFVVTPKTSSSNYSSGASAVTTSTAEQFASLLNSSTLVTRVRKLGGEDVAGASVSASAVSGTNIIQLRTTGPNPRSAYYMCLGILDNYQDYAQYVFNSVILESVTSPTVPGKQALANNQRRAIVIAAPVGAVLMIALLALLTIISGTIQTVPGAREQVDGTLLVTLNHQRKRRTLKSLFRRRKSALLISNPTTSFLYVETIHQLRARVEHTHRAHGAKLFLITSVSENEGKSTVAANVALSLARRHKRVLLLDCDLRKPAQHLIFDAKEDRSLCLNGFLRGELGMDQLANAIHYRKAENLYHLFARSVQRHSAELLGSAQMKRLLQLVKGSFDYVIMDSPPMGFFTDSEVLCEQADASMLVVRQDLLTDKGVNDAIDALERCKARFMGYVFNDVRTMSLAAGIMGGSRYGYGYGYGRGYGYGYGYGGYKRKQGYGYGYGYGSKREHVSIENENRNEED